MASGFILVDREDTTFKAIMREMIAKASTQFTAGDGLIITAGALAQATNVANTLDAVFQSLKYPASVFRPVTENLTSTIGEHARYIPCRGNGLIFETKLTGSGTGDSPPINGIACNTNAVTTVVKVPYTGTTSSGDFTGGTVYANGEQREIISSTYSGGVHTLNVTEPFTVAITTTHTAIVVPFMRGTRGVKLNPNTIYQGISTSVADNNGGKVNIERVFLTDRSGYSNRAWVSFQA